MTSAPSSTSATPSSRSSSVRQASAAATGEATIALHAEVRRADDVIDVAQRRRVGGDDVDVDPEPVGVEPDRLLDPLDPVDRVERRMGVEHDLAAAVDRRAAAGEQLVDVRLLDLVAAKLDLDIGDVADQPAGAIARPDFVDGHARHALGQLDRFAHRELARFHVGDVAALDPAAFALAGAEHAQPAVVVGRDDQRADLRRADVERGDERCCRRATTCAATHPSAGASGGDRLARRARQADDHLAGNAQVEPHQPAAEQAGRAVDLGELGQRRARRLLALGQRDRLARSGN